jgi:hypothetical protein
MRALLRVTLISSLLVWCAAAQRGGHGGGGGGGGFHGGGGGMGGGFRGGGFGGGGGFRGGGGFGGGFNRGGFGYGYGFNRGGFGYGRYGYGYGRYYGGWPYWGYGWGYPGYGWGLGVGYWPGYYGSYDYPYDYGYGYDPGGYAYNPSPNVAVYQQGYPQQGYAQPMVSAPVPAYNDTAHPVIHTYSYDQYGQEVRPSGGVNGSPIYLIATKDGVIHAAASYWVQQGMVHYVTLQHEEKTVPVANIDHTLTDQLNRERHVNLNLVQ